MKSPCYGCTERHEACHGSCERYKEWQAPFLEEQKAKLTNIIVTDTLVAAQAKQVRANGRRPKSRTKG